MDTTTAVQRPRCTKANGCCDRHPRVCKRHALDSSSASGGSSAHTALGALSDLSFCACLTYHGTSAAAVARAGDSIGNLSLLDSLVAMSRRQLRVFTYHGIFKPSVAKHMNTGYHVDVAFAERLAASGLSTHAGEHASLFFVPFSASTCRFTKLDLAKGGHRGNLRSVASCASDMRDGVAKIAARWPYLARRNGSDHLWVTSHDAGRDFAVLSDVRLREPAIAISNSADLDATIPSSVLLPSAHRQQQGTIPPFDPTRHVSGVPYVGGMPAATTVPRPSRRSVLAFFVGTVRQSTVAHEVRTGRVREILVAAGRRFNAEVASTPRSGTGTLRRHVRLVRGSLQRAEYVDALLDAVFCLAPRGHAVWSPRLIEAILHGCIPVVLADTYWLPFTCFVDWRKFSVRVPEAEAGRVLQMLEAMSEATVVAMHAELLRVRHLFAFSRQASHTGAQPDAFDVLLLEAYLRGSKCVAPVAYLN